MNCEQFWNNRKEVFLEQAQGLQSNDQLLSLYREMMEQMKTNAMSSYPHEDVLRQQIALLFSQAIDGSDLIQVSSQDVVLPEPPKGNRRGLPANILQKVIRPSVLYPCMGGCGVLALLAGTGGWQFTLLSLGMLGALSFRNRLMPKDPQPALTQNRVRRDYLNTFMTRQSRQLDKNIEDLKTLLLDATLPDPDVTLDNDVLTLCQYMWGVANVDYPMESALYTAEKLLRKNDLTLIQYRPELRRFFDVLPTKYDSRTVYPALCRVSDGTLIRKGQYVEKRDPSKQANKEETAYESYRN